MAFPAAAKCAWCLLQKMNWESQFWGKTAIFEEEGRKENNFLKKERERQNHCVRDEGNGGEKLKRNPWGIVEKKKEHRHARRAGVRAREQEAPN